MATVRQEILKKIKEKGYQLRDYKQNHVAR